MAELCGRNNLAVHRPSQLASAVAPRLAFDRNAYLAVNTGKQPCAEPGQSSIIFRPQHGKETIDPVVLEKLNAPIIKEYGKDGTAVFDAAGGAQVSRLQDPEEITVFCVDSSASMRSSSDFEEVNTNDTSHFETPSFESQAARFEHPEVHAIPSLDDTEESLASYEGFNDMLGIIAAVPGHDKGQVTRKVLNSLTTDYYNEYHISSIGLQDGDHITIRLPKDTAVWGGGARNGRGYTQAEPCELCLIKVYSDNHSEVFSYWVNTATTETVTSVIWKFWRYTFQHNSFIHPSVEYVTTNVRKFGDGWHTSKQLRGTDKLQNPASRTHDEWKTRLLGEVESDDDDDEEVDSEDGNENVVGEYDDWDDYWL